ncbi:MAG: hypothetical protein PHP95_13340 [Desulfuromonadaceae bacterium]|nr:hypothetical protein [Desulfuromonadaceae bacterium]MDD2849430.1 hypothetical protein [Desulfuromonadaceae bacterium]MDD4130002.1 hypothetical protein [Desulfuromonadaceae bacterium]
MFKPIFLSLALLFCATIASTAYAAANRPAAAWNYYHFDGRAFIPGPAVDGNAFIAVREKFLPIVLTAPTATTKQTPLPVGTGVIAGICYLQTSGGKLGGSGSFMPCQRVPLTIFSAGKPFITVQTDDNGYFVVVLPAGSYSIGGEPFSAAVTVERGITTLAPLRAGKRMVD